jgi:hypothetical protein
MIDESKQHVFVASEGFAMPEPRYSGFRFGLRHLFWFVTATSILLAILFGFPGSGFGPLAILMGIAVIGLHLISTAVGSHLRAEADRETAITRSSSPVNSVADELAQRALTEIGGRSPLYTRGRPMGRLPLWVALGAAVGGVCGAVLLELVIGDRTSAVGIAVGAISTAIVGGWFAFLGGSFWAILRQGWRDAVSEAK